MTSVEKCESRCHNCEWESHSKKQTVTVSGKGLPVESPNIIIQVPVKSCLEVPHHDRAGGSGSERARSVYLEKIEISAAEEERRRTGKYLAVCLTLVMLFIACYHILMRQMPVLVGLLAPAIIMILYVIWLLYFAKKRNRSEISLV